MSEQLMRENMMVIAQTYADAKGWSLSTVSNEIHGNYRFLERYSAGEISVTVKTYYQMVDKFRANWPAGTRWPKTAAIPKLGKNIG